MREGTSKQTWAIAVRSSGAVLPAVPRIPQKLESSPVSDMSPQMSILSDFLYSTRWIPKVPTGSWSDAEGSGSWWFLVVPGEKLKLGDFFWRPWDCLSFIQQYQYVWHTRGSHLPRDYTSVDHRFIGRNRSILFLMESYYVRFNIYEFGTGGNFA